MKPFLKLLLNKREIIFPLALILLFIVVLIIFSPIKETFEYNSDEGINAIKSSLFLKGFSLYKEIWSDQPPLFTVLLAFWFKLFGASFYIGRILALLFLGLLLWAFYQTIRLRQGILCAGISCAFLILSAYFLRLGSSIMIGVPSWALAMSAIYLLTLYNKNRSNLFLLLSGLFMALSLQTKFSPAFLIPAILFELKESGNSKTLNPKNPFYRLPPALFWLITMAVFYFTITIIFFYPGLNLFAEQLFKPHMTRLDLPGNNPMVIGLLLSQDIDIVLWALVGIIINLRHKKSGIILPFSWLCLSLIVLAIYLPTWDHYYLFLSLPLCWLAAIGVVSLLPPIKAHSMLIKVFLAGLIILTIAAIPLKLIRTKNSLWGETNAKQREILNFILGQKEHIRWIATDMPEYAFYSGMPVPPEIAVATIKRRFTNGLSNEHFTDTLRKYRPELLLLGKFQDYSPSAMSYINENYLFYTQSQVSARTKGYLSPGLFISVSWNYIGQYLPARFRATNSRWFNDLIWRNLRVPIILIRTKQQEFYSIDARIDIFLRKDISGQKTFQ